MSAEEADGYYKAIRILHSREVLHSLTIADFPNLKASRRKKVHSSYAKKARLTSTVASTDQIAEMMARRLSGR